MTEIERKALALMNEVARERGSTHDSELLDRGFVEGEALCRAIEQHEAFKQEVSDAVERFFTVNMMPDTYRDSIGRFILPKSVDPLVEALNVMAEDDDWYDEYHATALRTALAKRGLEIREVEG